VAVFPSLGFFWARPLSKGGVFLVCIFRAVRDPVSTFQTPGRPASLLETKVLSPVLFNFPREMFSGFLFSFWVSFLSRSVRFLFTRPPAVTARCFATVQNSPPLFSVLGCFQYLVLLSWLFSLPFCIWWRRLCCPSSPFADLPAFLLDLRLPFLRSLKNPLFLL